MPECPTLTELANRYGVDKLFAHSYIPEYTALFENRRDMVKNVLEIGIGYSDLMAPFSAAWYKPGDSLRMWRDYFPNAMIYGCDIRSDLMFQENRIRTMRCDQSSEKDLEERFVGMRFDVIVDDGSHETAHQILSASRLYLNLEVNGIYVIEDVREPLTVNNAIRDALPDAHVTVQVFNKRPDDTLIVIERLK